MICNDCIIRRICKINDIINLTGAKVDIDNCEHYSRLLEPSTIKSGMSVTEGIVEFNTWPNGIQHEQGCVNLRESRALNDVSELSNKIRIKEKYKHLKVGEVEISDDDFKECPNCKDLTMITMACQSCGKEVCPSCYAVDLSDASKILCEQCDDLQLSEKQEDK